MEIVKETNCSKGFYQNSIVWMSHFDEVAELPEGFELNAKSGVIASISNPDKNLLRTVSSKVSRYGRRQENVGELLYSDL